MKAPKHEDILEALRTRNQWEARQATWYKMRHDGLRRRNKPWPNAADMHFPLADMLIEKLKPTYVAQIFATDTVASFVAQSSEHSAYQGACGQWFDYQLKQETNFEDAMPVGIDTFLQTGKAIVKALWNPHTKRLEFEAIAPQYLIVPPWTDKLVDADWIVHVQTYSEAAYLRLGMKQDEATLQAIKGKGDEHSATADTEKYQREGLTNAVKDDQIVVWEVYTKQPSGPHTVKTYSPAAPTSELRPTFGLPYNRGVFASDNPPPPFQELNCEVKDRGFYSPRGICERVQAFEVSLCKDWNTLKDYQTLTAAPLFSAESGVPQNANLRMVPGQILPFKLTALTFPPAPVDLHQNMNGTRALAEQLVAIPDAGLGRQDNSKEKRTAAEVNLIGSIMGRNDDLRSRIFRRELAGLLNLAWSILVQYKADALNLFLGDETLTLAPEALMGSYRIEPNGSGDNFNRGLVLQRAIARKQMFTGSPNINQLELDKSVIEADDPRLVKRLVLNQGSQQAAQQEDQAQEITIMLYGFQAEVRPADDDWSHIQSCTGFIQRRATLGEPLTAETMQLLAQHIETHLQALKKKNPQAFQANGQHVGQLVALLRQEAQAQAAPPQAPMPEAPMPDNVVPMGGLQ